VVSFMILELFHKCGIVAFFMILELVLKSWKKPQSPPCGQF
jgi:hypothetical protein